MALSKITKFVILIVCFILVFQSNPANASEKSLYFIQGQPQYYSKYINPYPTIIYILNENHNTIEPVWTLGNNVNAYDIRIFGSAGFAMISEGQRFPNKINVIDMNEISRVETIDLEGKSSVMKYRYYYNPKDKGWTDLKCWYGDIGPNPNDYKYFDISLKNNVGSANSMNTTGELMLAGPLPAYGSAYSDVLGLHIGWDGIITSKESIIDLEDTVVPNDLIKSDSSSRWMLIYNEPSFRIILSIPQRHGLTHRELLIFNRITREWQSIMIEGSETAPRLINNWLVGIIADTDAETDYIQRKGFPPLIREDAVIIDPISGHQFTVYLGKKGEILWIDNNDVYYRVGEELFKARIENDDFIDRTLLLSDPIVDFIHWAFRGK